MIVMSNSPVWTLDERQDLQRLLDDINKELNILREENAQLRARIESLRLTRDPN